MELTNAQALTAANKSVYQNSWGRPAPVKRDEVALSYITRARGPRRKQCFVHMQRLGPQDVLSNSDRLPREVFFVAYHFTNYYFTN